MPAKYVHLSGRDIDADYARLHGIEDETKPEKSGMAPVDCPRCGTKNDPEAEFCQKCGQALTREAFKEIEKEESVVRELTKGEEKAEGESLDEIINSLVEKKLKEKLGSLT